MVLSSGCQINYLDLKLKSSSEKYAEKIGWLKRIFIDEFPLIKVEASMINYLEQEKKYLIKSSSNLTYKFSIKGKKKIIFTTRDKFFYKSSENISDYLCGVIVESNFKFENDVYKQMLIHIGYDNESKPFYLFHFFKNSNECYQYLYSGEKYLDYENTILPEDYVIPFDKILSSDNDHLNDSDSDDDDDKKMMKIRNCLQLLNKFEKECNYIKISNEFKRDLLFICIRYHGISKNFDMLKINVNFCWRYYLDNFSG